MKRLSRLFRRAHVAIGPRLKIWDLHWSHVVALDTLKLATARFGDHEAYRLAAFQAARTERFFGMWTHSELRRGCIKEEWLLF
jgi:hypothetical protein